MNKFDQFQSLVYTKNFDIICVTETWLNNTVFNNEILPTSYTIYRKDRANRGGGVLIAINNSIPSQLCHISDSIEMISVHLNTRPKLLLICLYIPPNCTSEYQQNTLHAISNIQNDDSTIITGDLNAPDINWLTLYAGSPFSRNLCNTLHHLNYLQLVNTPTHQAGNTLDLILTNAPHRISNIAVSTDSTLNSDHFLVTADIFSHSYTNSTKPAGAGSYSLNALNYRKANLPALAEHLIDSLMLYDSFSSHSLESSWSALRDAITLSTSIFVPSAIIPSKASPRWFNASIRHQLNKVHSLRRRIKRHSTQMLRTRLMQMERDLQSLIQSAKENYLMQLVTTFRSNPRKLYTYLNNLSESKFEPHFIYYNNMIIHDPCQRAKIFNEYFNSTFTTSDYVLPSTQSLPAPSAPCLSELSLNESEVYEILVQLDTTKAMGCDNIHPLVLKHCSDTLAAPLTALFNLSLNTAHIPHEWKIHKIRPIPKGGDRSNVCNYRPISLLCTTSKVLEKAVYNRIISFIRPKLSKQQFGFLKGRSCLSQLLVSFAQVFNDLDRGAIGIDTVFLDFKKAFDSVPHNELLLKLWRIGITGKLWLWFQEYLTHRQHYVYLDNASSALLPVKSGVPQGSILGPLLFLIYINDLPECINYASCHLFADDAKLLKSVVTSNDCTQLQLDLLSLEQWCNTWRLNLNQRKCTHLRLSLSNQASLLQTVEYKICETTLESVTSQRDLGVIVTNTLSWSLHYGKLCQKAYNALHLIKRSLPESAPVTLKKQLYISLVRSFLSYCSQVWKPRYAKDISCLERIQRRSTKYILNDYSTNYKSRLQTLHLLPIALWLDLHDLLFLVKCLQDQENNFEIHRYITFRTTCTRTGSTGRMLIINYTRTSAARHFYFNRIVLLWNSVQPAINLNESFQVIRYKLINFLWSYFINHFNPLDTCTYHLVCPCNNCHASGRSTF